MRDMLLSLLMQDLPESFIITLACYSFLCLRWDWRKISVITGLMTLTNLVRLLPIAFGVHSVILFVLLAIYLNYFTKAPMSKTLSAAVICLIIIASMQIAYLGPLFKVTGLSSEQALSSPVTRSLFSLPYFIVLLTAAFFKNRYNYRNRKFID